MKEMYVYTYYTVICNAYNEIPDDAVDSPSKAVFKKDLKTG